MHPACPNKEQNHLQNSVLRRTQFWVRKTFSKPASLKRASLVAFPVAISHKASVETKTLRFFNPDAKNFIKIKLNTVPKMGPPGGPILGPHAQLSKRTKEKHFHGPILGPSGGTKNETAKSQNQQQRPSKQKLQLRLFEQKAYRFGTEEARTCEA